MGGLVATLKIVLLLACRQPIMKGATHRGRFWSEAEPSLLKIWQGYVIQGVLGLFHSLNSSSFTF